MIDRIELLSLVAIILFAMSSGALLWACATGAI